MIGKKLNYGLLMYNVFWRKGWRYNSTWWYAVVVNRRSKTMSVKVTIKCSFLKNHPDEGKINFFENLERVGEKAVLIFFQNNEVFLDSQAFGMSTVIQFPELFLNQKKPNKSNVKSTRKKHFFSIGREYIETTTWGFWQRMF